MYKININPVHAVIQAVACLKNGNVIAVPTDTVYGLAASAQNSNAIQLLYEIKARDLENPIAVCVSKVSDIESLGETRHLPLGLLDALLPGPVTVVLERSKNLNSFLNPGISSVGIRVPNDTFIRKVVQEFGQPIALTSANVSSEPSTLRITEFEKLWPRLGAIFDGGDLSGSRKGSTIVDLRIPKYFKILRDGSALQSTKTVMDKFEMLSR